MTSSRALSSRRSITHPTELPHMNELGSRTTSKHEEEYAITNSMLEMRAFEEDLWHNSNWPPPSYCCSFCRRLFTSAQALGGHMNVHRRDRARYLHTSFQCLQAPVLSSLPLSFNLDNVNEVSKHSLAYPILHPSFSSPTNFDPPICTLPTHDKKVCASTSSRSLCGSTESDLLSTTRKTFASRLSPLEGLQLLKEKCRGHGISSKSSTNTKAIATFLHQPICLQTSSKSKIKSSSLVCEGSQHEDGSPLLKDALSSCNILDLELRLGQKNGA